MTLTISDEIYAGLAAPASGGGSSGGDVVTATNSTGSSIASGDKVFIDNKPVYNNNFNIVGSPYIDYDAGVVSGFTTGDYLQLSEGFSGTTAPWEIKTACMITRTASSDRVVFSSMAGTGGVFAGVTIGINTSNQFYLQLGLTTSSYDTITASFTVVANTKYYLKASWSGSVYTFSYSTDDVTYTTIGTYSSSTAIYSASVTRLGAYGNSVDRIFVSGSIYLSETYIKVDGVNWWVPTMTRVADYSIKNFYSNDRNYSEVGSPTINDSTGIVSGFSSSNYLQTKTFNFGTNDYEIVIKFKITSTASGYYGLLCASSNYKLNVAIDVDSMKVHTAVGDGSTWKSAINGTTTLQLNKWYWYKVKRSSGYRNMYLSEDGSSWSFEGSAADTYSCNTTFYLGRNDSGGTVFNGEIELKETYVNGTNWFWLPYNINVTKNYLTGIAQEDIASGSSGKVETILPEA